MRKLLIVVAVLAVLVGLFLLGRHFFDSPAALIQSHLHIPKPKPGAILSFHLGSMEIHITNTVFASTLAMLLLIIWAVRVSRSMRRRGHEECIRNPRGLQGFAEWAMEYIINLVEGAAGQARMKKRLIGRVVFPLVGTLFIFIIFANWISLVPGFSSIVVASAPEHVEAVEHTEDVEHGEHTEATPAEHGEEHEEHAGPPIMLWLWGKDVGEQPGVEPVPLLRAANSHLSVTAGMALVAVICVQAWSISAHGVRGYLKHLATDAPVWMRFLMFPIHVLSEISHVISLSARLFGNLYGGDVLLAVMFNLIGPALPALFLGFEAFFYYIQALLFSVLTTVYVILMAETHGEHAEATAH
jgi:F-type H+-transporting ATPase subunit a